MSQNAQVPQTEQLAMLNAWSAAFPTPLKLGLFTGSLIPNANTAIAEVAGAMPTGSWYTPKTVTLHSVYDSFTGLVLETDDSQFCYSGSDSGEVVTGCFAADDAMTRLVMSKRFDAPVTMANALDCVTASIGCVLPPSVAS